MHLDKRKEDFSIAMVRAVAATCGWTVGEWSQDMDGIDTTLFKAVEVAGKIIPKSCDFQLKCTESPTTDNSEFISFTLKPDHYNRIKNRCFSSPFILCVVVVPNEIKQWYQLKKAEKDQLHFDSILKHCGYAKLLADHDNMLDDASKTVRFTKGKDELSIENLNNLETVLWSPGYNLEKARAEREFWAQQQQS